MSKPKLLIVVPLLAALLAMQFGSALAAPAVQESTPVVGTVQTITVETDPVTQETTVVVVVLDTTTNITQTVRLSAADAQALGLVTLDPATNTYVAVDPKTLPAISIDPALLIPEETPVEEAQHPVGGALADFFSAVLGVDYDAIMAAHDEGVGFGVIAQALWMTNALEGDSLVFDSIIQAKLNNDYSGITLPDGSVPTNWGQFRKAILSGNPKANLGQIMSGHADPLGGEQGAAQAQGIGRGQNKDKGNNGRGHNK
jgi:hypothetical protein